MSLAAVVAVADNGVIGDNGDLPWHLPEDLRWFKELTLGHVVICGRLTHESIQSRLGGPLPGRHTVVVSSSPGTDDDEALSWAATPEAACDKATSLAAARGRDEVFVIGGATVYAALQPRLDLVYLTRVHADVQGDTTLPDTWLDGFRQRSSVRFPDGAMPFTREVYERA